jgi:Tol biopolymer transport system component
VRYLSARRYRVIVAGTCTILMGPSRSVRRPASAEYTIAFKSFAPNNADVFVANPDGSGARPLVPSPAQDYDASFSADGRWVLFTSHRGGQADVYRVHPDGSDLEQLTHDPAFDDQAALSPDGRSLAFVSSRGGHADIWVMDLRTRSARNLTRSAAGNFRPVWSPDGRWIAFSSDRDRTNAACPNTTAPGPASFVTPQYTSVYMMRSDGAGLRRLSDSSEIAGTPRWSPDGVRVFFYVGDPAQICRGGLMFGTGTTQIVVENVNTAARDTLTRGPGVKVNPRPIGPGRIAYQVREGVVVAGAASTDTIRGDFECPDWSPDHHLMVFHRETDSRGDRDRPLQHWPSPDPRFALLRVPDVSTFSPSGDRMVYLLTNFAGPIRSGSLVAANADGSNRKVIFEGPLTEDMAGPAWSPRGDAIAFGVGGFFQRAQVKPAQLMRVAPDGSGLTVLTHDTVSSGMPSWSPDGSQIVYRAAHGRQRELRILDVATGRSRRLETGSDFDTFPSWSPRGDWIAFTSKRDGDYEIYRIHPDGTGLQRLTHLPGTDAHESFSPDGEWIAFASSAQGFKDEAVQLLLGVTFQPYGEIAVMRADGSDFHLLTDNSTEEGAPVWVPQSSGRRARGDRP